MAGEGDTTQVTGGDRLKSAKGKELQEKPAPASRPLPHEAAWGVGHA